MPGFRRSTRRPDEGQAVSTSSTKRGQFWRADWFVALLVVIAVLVLFKATDAIDTLDRRFYDYGSTSSGRLPSDRIAIIAIDDQSIANIGRWPWSRDVHAKLIDQLAAADAKTIAYTAFFVEPQTDRGLPYIRKIKATLAELPASPAAAPEPVVPILPMIVPLPAAKFAAEISAARAAERAAHDTLQTLQGQLDTIIKEAEITLDTDAMLGASM